MNKNFFLVSSITLITCLSCPTVFAFDLDSTVEEALLKGEWNRVIELLTKDNNDYEKPVPKILLAHGSLATNRNNAATLLFLSIQKKEELSSWSEWTSGLLDTHPDNCVAQYLAGDGLARTGSLADAIQAFSRITESDKSCDHEKGLSYNARGIVHVLKKNPANAWTDFILAVRYFPNLADAHANFGALSVFQEVSIRQGTEALKSLNKALELNPQFALAYNSRGCLYFGNGQFEQAAEDFRTASHINPLLNIFEVNEDLAEEFASGSVMLAGLKQKPGMTIETRIIQHASSLREDQKQRRPDAEFAKQVFAIHRLSPEQQQALINKYGWEKVRSAVEFNIEANRAQALAINMEAQKLHIKSKIHHKFEMGLLFIKGFLFASKTKDVVKNFHKMQYGEIPKGEPIRPDTLALSQMEGAKSLQRTLEKTALSSIIKNRTGKVILDAVDPNVYKSIRNSSINIADSILDNQTGALKSLSSQANLDVQSLAIRNRSYFQFLNSRNDQNLVKRRTPKPAVSTPGKIRNLNQITISPLPHIPPSTLPSTPDSQKFQSFPKKGFAPKTTTLPPLSEKMSGKALLPSSSRPINPTRLTPRMPTLPRVDPPSVPKFAPRPGGVTTEVLAKVFVDKGNWPVMTTFGLFYNPILDSKR